MKLTSIAIEKMLKEKGIPVDFCRCYDYREETYRRGPFSYMIDRGHGYDDEHRLTIYYRSRGIRSYDHEGRV